MSQPPPSVGRWIRRLLVAVISLGLLFVTAMGVWWYTAPLDTVGKVDFDRPLVVPPLAESTVDEDGRRVFELEAQQGSAELLPGTRSDTWGFNGGYLGPTLRAERGEDVRVDFENALDEPTTVHWHGMHLPAEMDGGPHQMVGPGDSWSPEWKVDQPAATLWYHPHPHGETEKHVYRGLAGMFILDDPDNEAAESLPHEYGVDDVPLIVQDKSIDDDGGLGGGEHGDTILVNGTAGPYLDVTTGAVRLRLLNASTSRVYEFGLSDGRDFAMVGSDGGLLPEPLTMSRLRLSPGERAEIVVRLEPGARTVLRSYPPELGMDAFSSAFAGGRDTLDVLELRAAKTLSSSPELPDELAPAPDLDNGDAEVTRRFELQGRRINGRKMDMSRIDETIELGSTEVWEVANTDGRYHNFHVHDVQFAIADVDGAEPPPELRGWKDTVFIPPGDTVRLAMRFTDYADGDTPYMFHCHLLMHEDRGMMGQFVVDAGDEAETPSGDGIEHDARASHH